MSENILTVAVEAAELHNGGLTYREVDEVLNLTDRFPSGKRYGKNGEVYDEVAYFLTKAPEVKAELAHREAKRLWAAFGIK